MKRLAPSLKARIFHRLTTLQGWLRQRSVLEAVSIVKKEWTKESSYCGDDRLGTPHLSVYLDDRLACRVQYKTESQRYWLYLNIGALSMQTQNAGAISFSLLQLMFGTLNVLNTSAKVGSIAVNLEANMSVSLIYCVPLPWWSLYFKQSFIRFVKQLEYEALGHLNHVLATFVHEFQTAEAYDEEFDLDDEFEGEPDTDQREQ